MDWTAIRFAAAGIIMMAFTLAWRVNPVEGSVVPDFLVDNPVGQVVHWILLVTCMPVFIFTISLAAHLPGGGPSSWILVCAGMMAIQGLLYFLVGKGIASTFRRLRGKRAPSIG